MLEWEKNMACQAELTQTQEHEKSHNARGVKAQGSESTQPDRPGLVLKTTHQL